MTLQSLVGYKQRRSNGINTNIMTKKTKGIKNSCLYNIMNLVVGSKYKTL